MDRTRLTVIVLNIVRFYPGYVGRIAQLIHYIKDYDRLQ